MTKQDAYNEWLLKFGFRWVEPDELSDNDWGLLKTIMDKYIQYHYNAKTDTAYRRLKQQNEIKEP